ncbi:hypothetical protein BDW67DRAFT_129611 [Aspergillus spinulosporus]
MPYGSCCWTPACPFPLPDADKTRATYLTDLLPDCFSGCLTLRLHFNSIGLSVTMALRSSTVSQTKEHYRQHGAPTRRCEITDAVDKSRWRKSNGSWQRRREELRHVPYTEHMAITAPRQMCVIESQPSHSAYVYPSALPEPRIASQWATSTTDNTHVSLEN